MRRAYKYRLWTNANQERELVASLETHRRLYNACLEQRKVAYEATKKSVKYTEQSSWFKTERTANPYFARLNFSSAQATMRRLERSYQNFFRRVKGNSGKPGFPRFKNRDRFNSFTFPAHGDGIRLKGDRLRIQHVGVVRVKLHRPVGAIIKTVTLKREADRWYAVFSCEVPDFVGPPRPGQVGIDVGLSSFLTTDTGETEPNPRYLKGALPELRRRGRAVSRKQKGGRNRRKAVRRLARQHARVANLRREHHLAVANRLVRRFGLIAAESLNIRGMLGNGRLSRAIADAAWGGFLQTLRCKAESAGAVYVEVDARGTSQTCVCGQEVRKTLAERWHDCPGCGLSMHRDRVSAKVILARGLARTGPVRLKDKACPAARSRRL